MGRWEELGRSNIKW